MSINTMKNVLVLSASLNEDSVSRRLADYAYKRLKAKSEVVTFCDLRAYNVPMCNGLGGENSHYADPHVKTMHDIVDRAHSIILATPIYNYAVAASLKNLIELTGTAYGDTLTGNAWRNKLVGFLLGAGTPLSYMSGMSVANSLMLDFACLIYPKFVHATRGDFDGEVPSTKVVDRLEVFVNEFYDLHEKLNQDKKAIA